MQNYKVLKQIGRGSFGKVLLVERVSATGETPKGAVAASVPNKFVLKQIEIPKTMPAADRVKCLTEIETLLAVQHSPYVVRVYESFTTYSPQKQMAYLCIVMEYCEGGDLYERVLQQRRAGRGFSERQVLEWLVMTASALKHIHGARVIHRDVKNSNVFLTRDGCVKVGDFGIAKRLQTHDELARTAIGTPYYTSPEICKDAPYSTKSDMWQLGCALYELVALRHPFDAQNVRGLVAKITHADFAPVSTLYSQDLRDLVAWLLQKDPAARPSADEVLRSPVVTNFLDAQLAVLVRKQQALFKAPKNSKNNKNKKKKKNKAHGERKTMGLDADADEERKCEQQAQQNQQNVFLESQTAGHSATGHDSSTPAQGVSRHESLNNFLLNNNIYSSPSSSDKALAGAVPADDSDAPQNLNILENAFVKTGNRNKRDKNDDDDGEERGRQGDGGDDGDDFQVVDDDLQFEDGAIVGGESSMSFNFINDMNLHADGNLNAEDKNFESFDDNLVFDSVPGGGDADDKAVNGHFSK